MNLTEFLERLYDVHCKGNVRICNYCGKVNGRESKALRIRMDWVAGFSSHSSGVCQRTWAMSTEFRDGLPLERPYAEDLVLMAQMRSC